MHDAQIHLVGEGQDKIDRLTGIAGGIEEGRRPAHWQRQHGIRAVLAFSDVLSFHPWNLFLHFPFRVSGHPCHAQPTQQERCQGVNKSKNRKNADKTSYFISSILDLPGNFGPNCQGSSGSRAGGIEDV